MDDKTELIKLVEALTRIVGLVEEHSLSGKVLKTITSRQLYYLELINRFDTATASELASHARVSKPTVTIALQGLLEQGYIRKVRSEEDKRVFHIVLTTRGRQICTAHDKGHRMIVEQVFSSLNPTERKQFTKTIRKVISAWETRPGPADRKR